MKLLNQGERIIFFEDNGKSYELTPKKGVDVSEETGKKLKKLFAGELITFEDVVQNFQDAAADAIKEVEQSATDIADTATPKAGESADAGTAADDAADAGKDTVDTGNEGADASKGRIAGFFGRS